MRAAVLLVGIAACGRGGFTPEGAAIELPAAIDFATVGCTEMRTQPLPVVNQGQRTLDFRVTSTVDGVTVDPTSGQIAAGETLDMTVHATSPSVSSPGTRLSGDLVFETNIPGEEIVLLPVSLQLEGAVIKLDADIIDFGEVTLGQTKRQDVVIANEGTGRVTVSISNSPSGRFTVIGDPSAMLNAADSHAFTIEFAAGGTDMTGYSEALDIAYSGALCQPPPATIDVSGYATSSTVLVSPLSFEFGDVTCGSPAADRATTITNNSAGSVTYSSTEMGDINNYFTNSNGNGTIAPGSNATITVTKTQTPAVATPGDTTANLRVVAAATKDLPIHQKIAGPVLSAATTSIDFGVQKPGTVVSRLIAFTNAGNAIAVVSTMGPFATPSPQSQFSVSPTTFTIAPGGIKDVLFTVSTGTDRGRFTKSFTFSAQNQCSPSITVEVAVNVQDVDGDIATGSGAGAQP